MARVPTRLLDVVSTLVRLGLAVVWLVAGGIKLANIEQNYVSVRAFEVLPQSWVGPVASAQPFLEVALGVLLLLGIGTRVVAGVAGVLLVLFIAGIAQAWARGLSIDCGCFSSGGQVAANQTRYPQEILRDVGFLAMSVWLLVRPHTLVAVDTWMHGGRHEVVGEDRDAADGDAQSAGPVGVEGGR